METWVDCTIVGAVYLRILDSLGGRPTIHYSHVADGRRASTTIGPQYIKVSDAV